MHNRYDKHTRRKESEHLKTNTKQIIKVEFLSLRYCIFPPANTPGVRLFFPPGNITFLTLYVGGIGVSYVQNSARISPDARADDPEQEDLRESTQTTSQGNIARETRSVAVSVAGGQTHACTHVPIQCTGADQSDATAG